MYSTSSIVACDTSLKRPMSCRCGHCFEAPNWPENSSPKVDIYQDGNNNSGSPLNDHPLTNQILSVYNERNQSQDMKLAKKEIRQKLEDLVLNTVDSFKLTNPKVVIIGSTECDIALDDSDLDLCLTSTRSWINKYSTLNSIGKALKEQNFIFSTPYVEGKARYVLKFMAGNSISKFRVDLQIMVVEFNMKCEEPIRNTNLIANMVKVDRRFQILAIIVKLWAKRQDIYDASKYRLSSYNLVLIIIQYLQIGCNPPVLPIVPGINVQGFNDTFQEGRYCSSNKQSLGELLLGFFRFYSEQFNFDKQLVSVTRRGERCRSLKLNSGKFHLYVEEPFRQFNSAPSVKQVHIFQQIKDAFKTSYVQLSSGAHLNRIL